MPITNTVQLGEIVTVSGDALGDSILQFWGVPLVGAVLLLLATLHFGPVVMRTIMRLMGRNSDGVSDRQLDDWDMVWQGGMTAAQYFDTWGEHHEIESAGADDPGRWLDESGMDVRGPQMNPGDLDDEPAPA